MYPPLAEQLDALAQRVGNLHLAALLPERRVIALVVVIVHGDEIADALDLVLRQLVVVIHSGGAMPPKGNRFMMRSTAVVIVWMLVDSSGSMNPAASPIDTTFLFQAFTRRPALMRTSHGSFTGLPPESLSRRWRASSSDM